MPIRLNQGPEGLELPLPDLDAMRAFFTDAVRQNGFLVELDTELRQFSVHPLTVTADEVEMRCEAVAIQVFPGAEAGLHQIAFELKGWTPARAAELASKLRQSRQPPSEEDASAKGETLGTSPVFRIKQLTVPERMRLAMKATRTERQILLRDNSPQVLLGLLTNPRIEDREVLELVRSTQASGEILKRVASTRRWSTNAEIRAAVVKNPKTPTPLALRLLDSLRTPELGILAKAGSTREKIRRAALALYLKRVSRR